MGLEESPHCPFDVMEACRTGVRRDSHQPGWKCSRPTAWPSPSATATTAAKAVALKEPTGHRTLKSGWRRQEFKRDEITEAAILAKAAEVAGYVRPGMAPVVANHRELSAGDDDDRHLPGH